MTDKVFIISDTHFGHSSTFEVFKNEDGTPLRPFKSLDEMHQIFIDNWNGAVNAGDLVLHLGDVAFSGQAYDEIMPQLNGNKYLIRGNHDRFSEGRYRRFFKRVLGCYVRERFVFTHVPIHPQSLSRWKGNIHGHLHGNKIMHLPEEFDLNQNVYPDSRYFNASVEQINYTPINFETVKTEYFGQR